MSDGAARSGWALLSEELDLWREAGIQATFWWRDDDAIEPTPQLETLLACAGDVPLSLAVIPDKAAPALAKRLAGVSQVTVLQHGWRHESHLDDGVSEYPEHRLPEEVAVELVRGRERLAGLFDGQLLPVFVPPWHGFADTFLDLLPENGIAAISRKGPRAGAMAAPRLYQHNAHVSPIKWTEPPSFDLEDRYLTLFVEHLKARRLGQCDREEATGLLTHHLAQNAESFDFIERLVQFVRDHPAAAWVGARDVFAPALRASPHTA